MIWPIYQFPYWLRVKLRGMYVNFRWGKLTVTLKRRTPMFASTLCSRKKSSFQTKNKQNFCSEAIFINNIQKTYQCNNFGFGFFGFCELKLNIYFFRITICYWGQTILHNFYFICSLVFIKKIFFLNV